VRPRPSRRSRTCLPNKALGSVVRTPPSSNQEHYESTHDKCDMLITRRVVVMDPCDCFLGSYNPECIPLSAEWTRTPHCAAYLICHLRRGTGLDVGTGLGDDAVMMLSRQNQSALRMGRSRSTSAITGLVPLTSASVRIADESLCDQSLTEDLLRLRNAGARDMLNSFVTGDI